MSETLPLGEWLPDLPFYNNPGLVEALNTIPVDGAYKDYLPLLTSDDALGARPQGAYAAIDSSGGTEIYAGTETQLLQKQGTSWTDRSGIAYSTPSNGYWRLAQFDDLIIGTNFSDLPQSRTVGSGANFANLATTGTAPRARQIGVINRFVILGDTDEAINGAVPWRVQWPAIDDPTNWQTPNTSGARAVQAGEQFLNSAYGAVTAIANGQFYGLVLQQRAVTRFTYVGGDIVFQIQVIDENRGCWVPQSLIQVGGISHFVAVDGFYRTDGQTVVPIGNSKIDKTFLSDFNQTYRERMTGALDLQNKCIFWAYPSSASSDGTPDKLICYNFVENRFTHATDAIQLIFSSLSQGYTLDQLDSLFTSIDDMTLTLDSSFWQGGIPTVMGFASNKLGTLAGTSAVARFETAEREIEPDQTMFLRGLKPLVTGAPSNISISVAVRALQDNSSRTFGTPTSRTARTGWCDFRESGQYVSARMEITGGFDRAFALQVDAQPDGFT